MFVDTVWGWSMRYDKTTSCHGISDKGSRRPQLPALTSALNVLAFMANSVSLKTWKLHVIAVNARASTDNPCHWPFLPLLGGCVRFKKRAMKRKKEKQKRKKKQIYQYRQQFDKLRRLDLRVGPRSNSWGRNSISISGNAITGIRWHRRENCGVNFDIEKSWWTWWRGYVCRDAQICAHRSLAGSRGGG